ncbi:MAG: hypothetical protein IPJ04_17185 [Candidatus Eisenbacteria bacterium]|nr:hypothetical protein [Candidatus Eisenbacteria bacterium]
MFRELSCFALGAMRRSMHAACAVLALAALAPTANALTVRDSSFVTDGSVLTMQSTGSTLFLGGSFTRIGPFTGDAVIMNTANPVPGSPRASPGSQVTRAAQRGRLVPGRRLPEAQGQPAAVHVRADGSIPTGPGRRRGHPDPFTAGGCVAGVFTASAARARPSRRSHRHRRPAPGTPARRGQRELPRRERKALVFGCSAR